jgi:hypothetical protein
MTLERFPDRQTVVAAEVEAIKNENPLFNRADNPNYRTWQTHFRELIDMCLNKRKVDDTHADIVHNLLSYSSDSKNFGTGKWLSDHFPPEWHEQYYRKGYDCDLCAAIATHPTVHDWAKFEEEL